MIIFGFEKASTSSILETNHNPFLLFHYEKNENLPFHVVLHHSWSVLVFIELDSISHSNLHRVLFLLASYCFTKSQRFAIMRLT